MLRKVYFALPAMLLVAASAGAADLEAGAQKAAACTGCHGSGSFADQSAADIEAAIAAIVAGDKMHPKKLDDLTPEDAANIAAFLKSGE